jgi:hypothetical protein
MTLTRIMSALGAFVLAGALVGSTYGAQAAHAPAPDDRSGQHSRLADRGGHFTAPTPHRYGPNGMRMGLHCETSDMS